jgi:hypothetical protein
MRERLIGLHDPEDSCEHRARSVRENKEEPAMKLTAILLGWMLMAGVTFWLTGYSGEETVWAADPIGETVQAAEPATPTWSGGGSIGFLANTPDDTAFAFNLHTDRFVSRNISLGPLLQTAFTGNMNQVGFSGQGKYWINLPETNNRLKLALQGGLGFIHSDFFRDDTSWLIPIGAGVDFAVNRTVSLTADFLLNFTDLTTGGGTGTNVMPGLTFGVRF